MPVFNSTKNKLGGWWNWGKRLISFDPQYDETFLYNAIKQQIANDETLQNVQELQQSNNMEDTLAPILINNNTLLMSVHADSNAQWYNKLLSKLNIPYEQLQNQDIQRLIVPVAQNGPTLSGGFRRHYTVLVIDKNRNGQLTVNSYDPKSKLGSLLYNRNRRLRECLNSAKNELLNLFYGGNHRPEDQKSNVFDHLQLKNMGIQSMFNNRDCGPITRQLVTHLVKGEDPAVNKIGYNLKTIRQTDQQVSQQPQTYEHIKQNLPHTQPSGSSYQQIMRRSYSMPPLHQSQENEPLLNDSQTNTIKPHRTNPYQHHNLAPGAIQVTEDNNVSLGETDEPCCMIDLNYE